MAHSDNTAAANASGQDAIPRGGDQAASAKRYTQRETSPHPTVLVVEDDRSISEMIQDALTDRGYQVVLAVDGAALPVARERRPAVILLDWHMPGMDGAEVSRRLRADQSTARIPIVAMSAGLEVRQAEAPPYCDDRLLKPFTLASLYAVVERRMKAS